MKNILSKDILPIPKSYSDDLKEMIDMLLKKDANLRPTIKVKFNWTHSSERVNFAFQYHIIHSLNAKELRSLIEKKLTSIIVYKNRRRSLERFPFILSKL